MKKWLCLFAAGALAVVLSLVWEALPYGMPRIKVAWTSSYALFAGGISAILLGLVYWIVDVRGWKRWGFFFKVIGLFWLLLHWMYRREIFLRV